MEFGKRIQRARTKKGLSQSRLAIKAGVSKTTVSGWETGNARSIDGGSLVAVARALQLTPEYIMTGKNPPTTDQLSDEEMELIELYHDLSIEEQAHVIGLLRAIHDKRTVPPLSPLFDQED